MFGRAHGRFPGNDCSLELGTADSDRRQRNVSTRRIPPPRPGRCPFLSEPRTFNARVLDVSKSGMRLKLSAPLTPGTLVQVELKSLVATGAVRHCRKAGEEYSMGIQLDAVVNKNQTV